jgi:hypothetical protein
MIESLYFASGWDDDCLGLVETLVRDVEWKEREAHNDAKAALWEVEAPDDWGNTPPTSLVPKGWLRALLDDRSRAFPCLSDIVVTSILVVRL